MVGVIGDKIDDISSECQTENNKVNKLKQDMKDIEIPMDNLDNADGYIATKKEFDKFEENIHNVMRDNCIQLRRKAIEQENEAMVEQERLFKEKKKRNLENRKNALNQCQSAIKKEEKLTDLLTELEFEKLGGDFASSQ